MKTAYLFILGTALFFNCHLFSQTINDEIKQVILDSDKTSVAEPHRPSQKYHALYSQFKKEEIGKAIKLMLSDKQINVLSVVVMAEIALDIQTYNLVDDFIRYIDKESYSAKNAQEAKRISRLFACVFVMTEDIKKQEIIYKRYGDFLMKKYAAHHSFDLKHYLYDPEAVSQVLEVMGQGDNFRKVLSSDIASMNTKFEKIYPVKITKIEGGTIEEYLNGEPPAELDDMKSQLKYAQSVYEDKNTSRNLVLKHYAADKNKKQFLMRNILTHYYYYAPQKEYVNDLQGEMRIVLFKDFLAAYPSKQNRVEAISQCLKWMKSITDKEYHPVYESQLKQMTDYIKLLPDSKK